MKKKVSLFLTALSCAVGAVAASEINSVQVAEVHGNVTAHKHRTDNNEYTRFRMGATFIILFLLPKAELFAMSTQNPS